MRYYYISIKWQPTPVFSPGKSQGWRRLVGYSPWGSKESDMTERLHFTMDVRVGLCEEGWLPKNWCFWTVVLEKTLESPLDCKEIQPVNSKGDQPWVFFGRNDVKAETPELWPPHAKSWLIGKESDAGRDWGQEEMGTTEDEMAGWHYWLDGREFEWTPGVGDGQGGLACCDSWGRKESDTTEQLNWTEQVQLSVCSLVFSMKFPMDETTVILNKYLYLSSCIILKWKFSMKTNYLYRQPFVICCM